ncbi:STAS domain-containing protein [Amycolatopsis sp. K13G38]|uniref:Anti-sigma factor antagonist n=1 Tax=Amycolatopsis acididurans TaxID=2724524 RepID=A0ABX1J7Y6_9PSEU|nr:STAS domain-containing protein [Amycolatopsis acididurans]NKQ54481.1 STAS domain-containing protein [Amycolatopsis acididurans]
MPHGDGREQQARAAEEVFTLEWERPEPDALVVRAGGVIDIASARQLREGIAAAHEVSAHPPDRLVLDLTGVTFLDSAGLAVLVETASRCSQDGCRFALACTSRTVLSPLKMTGLDRVLTVVSSVEDALAVRDGATS